MDFLVLLLNILFFPANPSIVTPPPNVDLVPGDSFFLPCVATGVPLPTTSWSRTTETGEEQQLELIGK